MKNHIVSQMIIKRFANAINVFDVATGRIDLKKKPSKVFYKHDRLSPDLEELLSTAIESRFANLLYGKLTNDHFVTLTRDELFLVKRYLLMISVRMYSENEFFEMMKRFKRNCDRYLIGHPEYRFLKRMDNLNLSKKEFYELTLRIYCEQNNPSLIFKDNRVTLEILCWARPILDSYLAIWDAPEGMEYVLSDCSMVSEYEGIHQLTGGLDLSKESYLLYHLLNENKDLEKSFFADTLSKCQLMYENFNVFNLSSKRSLVLINPFFRQYFNLDLSFYGEEEVKKTPVPDIWPSIIQNKDLFIPPITEYKSRIRGVYLNDDLFFYEARKLSPDELVYINSMIISMTHEILGFNDSRAIKDSIDFAVWEHANLINGDFISLNSKVLAMKFVDDLMNSALMKLSRFCGEPEKERKTYPIDLFRQVTQNMLKDFNENKYIYWYLLFKEKDTRNSANLAFLGDADKRIMIIKEKFKELWGKPYDK